MDQSTISNDIAEAKTYEDKSNIDTTKESTNNAEVSNEETINAEVSNEETAFLNPELLNLDEFADDRTRELNELNKIYKDPKTILDNILKIYKFVSTEIQKQLHEKTADDITDDVANAKYSIELDAFVKKNTAEILTEQSIDSLVQKKYSLLMVFIDFCFIYYVKVSSKTKILFHTMPRSLLRLKYIMAVMDCRDIELNGLFEDVVQNDMFKDLRMSDQIPFHLLTDLTVEEQRAKLDTDSIPMFKKILDRILRVRV